MADDLLRHGSADATTSTSQHQRRPPVERFLRFSSIFCPLLASDPALAFRELAATIAAVCPHRRAGSIPARSPPLLPRRCVL